ncbi:hypothetical protein CLV28_0806 [Sediminihabitans luteus]|uniref:Uncharacterized protein n=1 Tax=Sediminihabitans luteus TaxID=1138585 RepID=A0A2M9D055_9CELL|nr:hypothetical protein [Sediminihabitans luteus]PJJ77584.1 hypothetical protein CLV28_0806 [Sediminihabitans luteus]GII98484.1 hypothetical protein Slu03_08620 [Sediminihabitans luteus]
MNSDSALTLRDVAQTASDQHGGVRGRALGRLAEQRGLTLSYTTVDKILAGNYLSRPSGKTLEALAVLSGYPIERVYAAADLPMPLASLADQLPPDADLLSADQRRTVIDVVRQFARANREVLALREAAPGVGVVEPGPEQDQTDYSLAARAGSSRKAQERAAWDDDVEAGGGA